MKGITLGLAIAFALSLIFTLSPVHALNCTEYHGDRRDLCNAVDPLELSERDKLSLMEDNVYGQIDNSEQSISLNLENQEQPVTLNQIYHEKIIPIGQLVIFFLVNYSILSIVTKSFNILKWLTVVS